MSLLTKIADSQREILTIGAVVSALAISGCGGRNSDRAGSEIEIKRAFTVQPTPQLLYVIDATGNSEWLEGRMVTASGDTIKVTAYDPKCSHMPQEALQSMKEASTREGHSFMVYGYDRPGRFVITELHEQTENGTSVGPRYLFSL
jgi:hypothetical protein